MKQQTAKLKYLKIAPRKVRLVANLLKGLSVNEAEAQLLISPKRVGEPLLKLLRSAVANAKNNQKLDSDKLVIKEINVDQGPLFKKHIARAMGRATMIQKKSSHLSLVLAESDKIKTPRFKIEKPEKIKKAKAGKLRKGTEEKPKIQEKEKRAVKKPGFMKKMFRRKSI